MPKPKKDEKEKDFLSRCMKYPDMQKHDIDKRFAMCRTIWAKEKGKKKK